MKAFLPALFWALIIFILSVGPGISLPAKWWDLFSLDKLGHLVFYGILSFWLARGFIQKQNFSTSLAIKSLVLASCYGIALEGMQYAFFPGRYFEVLDIIANIIGSTIGLVFFRKFH